MSCNPLRSEVLVVCLIAALLFASMSEARAGHCDLNDDKEYAREVYEKEKLLAMDMTVAASETWNPIARAVLLGAQAGLLIGSLYWKKRADDPPSSDFTEIFQPRPRNLTAFYDTLDVTQSAWTFPEFSATLNVTSDVIKRAEFQEALTITLERHASACFSGNDAATRLQCQTVVTYGEELIGRLSNVKTSAGTLGSLWNSLLTISGVSITASKITQFQQEIAQQGLPLKEQEALRVLLVTDNEIAQMTSQLLAIDPLSAIQTTPITLANTIGDMSPLHSLVQHARSNLEVFGGFSVPIDRFGLLAPYIGSTSTIVVGTVATAICIKRVRHRKEKR